MGDSLNETLNSAIQWVQGVSQSGADNVGDVSNALLEAGFTLAQISNILNGVANSPITTQQQAQYLAEEQAYLAQQKQAEGRTWLFFGLAAVVVYLATTSK